MDLIVDQPGLDPGGLTDSVRQRLEIISMRDRRRVVADVTEHLPAAWRRQPNRVLFAQVVGMRLRGGCEGPHHGSGVGIDIGQRRDSRAPAA